MKGNILENVHDVVDFHSCDKRYLHLGIITYNGRRTVRELKEFGILALLSLLFYKIKMKEAIASIG